MEVEVIKKDDKSTNSTNKYSIVHKYNGKLTISNENYRISVKEKMMIEKNLQDGEILYCEYTKVEENQLSIKWNLNDNELLWFIMYEIKI